ncbi:MAG: SRPBCC family protein [Candidatus Binatia bacterium]
MVWDIITDLRRARDWAPEFGDYPFISPEWPKLGAKATWRCHVGPLKFNFALTITESARGNALQIVNRSIFGEGLEVYSFAMSGKTTTIWYDVSDQPNLLGRLVGRFFEKRMIQLVDKTIASLKIYCEHRAKGGIA